MTPTGWNSISRAWTRLRHLPKWWTPSDNCATSSKQRVTGEPTRGELGLAVSVVERINTATRSAAGAQQVRGQLRSCDWPLLVFAQQPSAVAGVVLGPLAQPVPLRRGLVHRPAQPCGVRGLGREHLPLRERGLDLRLGHPAHERPHPAGSEGEHQHGGPGLASAETPRPSARRRSASNPGSSRCRGRSRTSPAWPRAGS